MDYHAHNRSGDGVLQMPTDGSAFREIEGKWADFKDEPRNVRPSLAADGSIEKYKAIFVVRGFSQVEGVDYDETFAPVARYTSIRSIIELVASMGWKLHQICNDPKPNFFLGITNYY